LLIVFLRSLILYLLVVFVMRVMGKRQVGQLQPFEFVLAIMISDLVAVPMQDKEIPLINGIIPIITLLIAQLSLSYLTLKSTKARSIICGRPVILVENGRIVEEELAKLRYDLNDLTEQLRAKNFSNLSDVEFAILETNGELSVIPRSQKRPVVPDDLGIPTQYEGLTLPLVIDGTIEHANLAKANLDEVWLREALRHYRLTPEMTLVAILDTQGHLFVQAKKAAQSEES
jgi:uncharacterized membrane protein YcaP (DUF421 family)